MAVVESEYAAQKEQEKESEQVEESLEEEGSAEEKAAPEEGRPQKACSIEEKQRTRKEPERGNDSVRARGTGTGLGRSGGEFAGVV